MSATQFVIVRHVETVWNREGRIQGHLDSPLTAEGIAQAQALARRLRGGEYDLLVSSDLGRARATAAYIAAEIGMEAVLDARLRERHYGIFQGMTRGEAKATHPEVYQRYSEEDVAFAIPGGESTQAGFERSVGYLEELAACRPGQRILVVTHGGVIDGLYRHTMGLPHVGSRVFSMVNGSINQFSYEGGKWHLESWADVTHLDGSPLDDV
ncbi:histidine phosphatase family protein [uncultured Marinobacter sp.]|uniref:histidine phosphatase family protein n=1 Tax=uncultured Marinobacter sp. TaxID=187379 RepID=UPI0030DCF00C|tara:strand:- start:2439 stop:3071 length:633 start_codon:yes stop_codon:yes gene_type:complete